MRQLNSVSAIDLVPQALCCSAPACCVRWCCCLGVAFPGPLLLLGGPEEGGSRRAVTWPVLAGHAEGLEVCDAGAWRHQLLQVLQRRQDD